MAPRQCSSQQEKRQRILAAWLTNKHATKASIAKKSECDRRTVGLWVARFIAGDESMSDAHRAGRPVKLCAEQKRAATRHLTCARRATMHQATEVANQHCGEQGPVSERTVRRHSVEQQGSGLFYGKEERALALF
jgi:transposase